MKPAITGLIFLALFTQGARAAELGGVKFPDGIVMDGKKLVLNGLGLRDATFLKIKVYVAALYLEKKSSDAEAILRSPELKRVEMRFLRDVDAGKMRDAFREAFEANCQPNCEALAPKIRQIQDWVGDIREGEAMEFNFRPGKVQGVFQGKEKGTVEGTDFASVFLATWLGKKPPTEEVKEGMLGKR
jgi:hypothetical protein